MYATSSALSFLHVGVHVVYIVQVCSQSHTVQSLYKGTSGPKFGTLIDLLPLSHSPLKLPIDSGGVFSAMACI
jgi:hypothetical protein